MNKSRYFQTVYRRQNVIGEAFLNFFFALSSWPRMLLETLIRTNLGERYFSLSGAIVLAVVLGWYPTLQYSDLMIFPRLIDYQYRFDAVSFLVHYLSWYAFLGYFLVQAIQRNEEIKSLPSVFDFARFSLSTGEMNTWFFSRKINGKWADERVIATVLEPGVFFVFGLPLWLLFAQPLGLLLMISSVFYSLSYVAAQHNADNLVMDQIDQIIMQEELGKAIVESKDASQTRGVSFIGRRPADPELRRQVADMLTRDEELIEAR
jgi:hypothetical protein